MSDIELNGRKLIGAEILPQRGSDGEEIAPMIRSRSGSEFMMVPSDTLVIDGVVIFGPMAGWKVEERPSVPSGRTRRQIFYKGEHTPRCHLVQDGWLCYDGCTVSDANMSPRYHETIDSLVDILQEARRSWFRVHWALSRRSDIQRFVNGRCTPNMRETRTEVWHRGVTWTKGGARRKMDELSNRSGSQST